LVANAIARSILIAKTDAIVSSDACRSLNAATEVAAPARLDHA
jgi:hypothetical protein